MARIWRRHWKNADCTWSSRNPGLPGSYTTVVPKKRKAPRAGVGHRAPEPVSGGRRLTDIWICLLLLAAILCVYWQVVHFGFLNYDDAENITANPAVRGGLTVSGIGSAFRSMATGNWIPATWISHMVDCQLFGLKAGGHHLTSLLLHAISTLLLFGFLRRATGDRWPSAFVALMFALHPLHVESVAWVAERKDVLSAFFLCLSLWAYLRYVERPHAGRYAVLLLTATLGLLSKPMLVTLPFLLLLLDIWPLRRIQSTGKTWPRAVFLDKLPLLALSAGISIVAYAAQRHSGSVAGLEGYPFGVRLENALVSYVIYMQKTVWPGGLAAFYPYADLAAWEVLSSAVCLVGISILVLRSARARPHLAVGWFWFLGMLLPVIGLIQVGSQSRADRYMYLPMVGLSILIAWSAKDLLIRRPSLRAAIVVLAAGAGAAWMAASWYQTRYWAGTESLFRHALAVSRNPVAHLKLAEFYLDQGRFDESAAEGRAGVDLLPNDAQARIDLAAALGRLGRHRESLEEYARAAGLDPANAIAHSGLSVELSEAGKAAEALQEARDAVRLQPEYAEGRYNLGRLLAQANRIDEAIAQFSEAVRINPDNADFHCSLGIALGNEDRIDEAIGEFREAIHVQPASASAHFNLGSALGMKGDVDDAIAEFSQTLRIDPGFPGAQRSLENALGLKR